MAVPLKSGLPPDCVLDGGYVIRLTAVDAASGAVVTGVIVSHAELQVDQLSGSPGALVTPTPLIQPSEAAV